MPTPLLLLSLESWKTSALSPIHDPWQGLAIGMVHAQGTCSSYIVWHLLNCIKLEHITTTQRQSRFSQTISPRKVLYLVQLLSSPRYLDLFLCFSNEAPISCWLEFPIFMSYSHPIHVDDVSNQAPRPRALGLPTCFNELSPRKVAHSNAGVISRTDTS